MDQAMGSPALRYILNGLAAAMVHFIVLFACLRFVGLGSAGLANTIAACAGITFSFFGARHFVFLATHQPAVAQARRFGVLYAAMAAMHGLVMFVWSDLAGLDYRAGFLVGAALQAVCTYIGGRDWVFKASSY